MTKKKILLSVGLIACGTTLVIIGTLFVHTNHETAIPRSHSSISTTTSKKLLHLLLFLKRLQPLYPPALQKRLQVLLLLLLHHLNKTIQPLALPKVVVSQPTQTH
jgi:hypothetical protein